LDFENNQNFSVYSLSHGCLSIFLVTWLLLLVKVGFELVVQNPKSNLDISLHLPNGTLKAHLKLFREGIGILVGSLRRP